jgi:hypothetical protein
MCIVNNAPSRADGVKEGRTGAEIFHNMGPVPMPVLLADIELSAKKNIAKP